MMPNANTGLDTIWQSHVKVLHCVSGIVLDAAARRRRLCLLWDAFYIKWYLWKFTRMLSCFMFSFCHFWL